MYSRCHCPECRKWVPSSNMNYFEGLRVCDWCLNQKQESPPHDEFVYDPNFGSVMCIMCDSLNTRCIATKKYKCRECGEEFYI